MGLLFLFTAILSGAISERYKIRTEEVKRLRLTTEDIIKNLPTGIITIDGKGDIVYTNLPSGELQSRVHLHLAKFLKYPDTPKVVNLRIKQRSYLLSCAHIQNAQAALGILQDLTNIRRLEAKSRVSEQTKMLAELGGSLAHELRNPLSSIRGSLEVIAQSEKNKKLIPFISMAVKESVRLNSIVTDFLNFAQFTPKKINKMRIGDILTEAILEAAQIFKSRPVSLKREGGEFFIATDPDRLKSGIINILNNAFEASADHQTVTIRTYQERREGVLEIIDQGKGIAKKDLKKIFNPFFTTKKGGTGLGLAITQKIIEVHKGRIEVESGTGKGTVFRIILPLA
jgi:signal transduction histidine kinase